MDLKSVIFVLMKIAVCWKCNHGLFSASFDLALSKFKAREFMGCDLNSNINVKNRNELCPCIPDMTDHNRYTDFADTPKLLTPI